MKVNPSNPNHFPYPFTSLPGMLQDFVSQVSAKTQSDPSHAATVAISTMAAAIQGIVDVKQPYGETSPTSMYTWIVARSGERKSTIARLVNRGLENYELAALTDNGPADDEFIDVTASASASASAYASCTQSTSKNQFWFEDATTPSILESMADGSQSVFCSADEGALLLKFMDHATYCKWWDGSNIRHNRKDKPPILLQGRRVSLCVQLQDVVFDRLMKKKGDLLLDSGLFARTLFVRPESHQGMRRYTLNGSDVDLSSHPFHARTTSLIEQSLAKASATNFQRQTSNLDEYATRAWIQFCQNVEYGLGREGYYSDIPTFANRAGHMAVRLAAVLQFFAHDSLAVDERAMTAACEIIRWHLHQAKLTFGQAPEGYQIAVDAERLRDWLNQNHHIHSVSGRIPKSHVLRCGPTELRNKDRLDLALFHLEKSGLVAVIRENRTTYIQPPRLTALI